MYCPVDDHEGAGMTGAVMVMAAQNAGQGSAPSTLPVTGAASNPLAWGLAALALALLGVGLRLAQRTSLL